MPVKATVTPPMTASPNFTCVNVPLEVTSLHPIETLNKFKLKKTIETGLLKLDKSTEEQRALESEKITSRIDRVDLLITSLIFYTSLILQWLTLVGISTSFTNFLYQIFIGSFNFTRWDFSNIETIGKISGVTTSLQVILFVISNLVIFFYEIFHHSKSAPVHISGPTYFGGPFQLFNVLRNRVHEHNKATRKLDAKLSQYLGIASQLLIIVAAIVTDSKKIPIVNDFVREIQNFDPAGLGSSFVERELTPQNATRTDFSVKHAALFAKTTLLVSTLAIMMTSLLNIISWMADVWRTNQDEIIAYEVFKWITKFMVCEPCCCCRGRSPGESEDASNEVDEFEMAANVPEDPTMTTSNYPHTINDWNNDSK